MGTRWDIAGVFLISFLVSHGFTPLAQLIAVKFGFLDHPEAKKAHTHPTPLLGGLAIYVAFIASIIFAVALNEPMLGVFIGATLLLVIGIIDDKFGMMPQLKLSAQILAALAVFKFGLRINTIEDYYLSMLFTVFWIVGITNALNLLDNLNGLSSGIAAISSAFFCVVAFAEKDYMTAAIASGLVGACLGFLGYNFPKARIFMGDTGSLVIGFLLACLAIIGKNWATDQVTLSLSIPIVILAYPIFDTTLVTIIRISERRSIFQGGKDHSSHILAYSGFRKKKAVLAIFLICILLGASALVIKYSSAAVGKATLLVTIALMIIFGIRLLYLRRKMTGMRNDKKRRNVEISQ